jgi:hypothetical protein
MKAADQYLPAWNGHIIAISISTDRGSAAGARGGRGSGIWNKEGAAGDGYRGDAGDAGAAPSRLRRPRDSERAVAGRRGGGATPTHCGCFAIAKSNVAGFEYQYGGGTWRRKSSSAAFIAAMVCAA